MKRTIRPSHTFAIITILLAIVAIGATAAWYWARPNRGVPAPSPTSQHETTPANRQIYTVKLGYIALEDNGQSGEKIGCNDSLVLVDKTVTSPTAIEGAFTALFADKSEYYGQSGLYNALRQSDLSLEAAVIEDDTAHVSIEGTVSLSGTCDSPRIKAQLLSTAQQFADTAEVTINGRSLDEALSQR